MTTIEILEKFDIAYVQSGGVITKDAVGMLCPFCGTDWTSLGVFKNSGRFSCWKCNETGSLYDLLHELKGISFAQYKEETQSNVTFYTPTASQIESIINPTKVPDREDNSFGSPCKLPSESIPIHAGTNNDLLLWWLDQRKYTIQDAINYRCCYCMTGEYKYRIIIPIYHNGVLVSFQGADLTRKSKTKYRTKEGNLKDYLYNYDALPMDSWCMICEGVLDVWRMPAGAVATFGKKINNAQIALILKKKPKRVIVAWDSDAYWNSRALSKQLLPLVPEVQILHFPVGEDPDSYGSENTLNLLRNSEICS